MCFAASARQIFLDFEQTLRLKLITVTQREKIYGIASINDIDTSPVDWSVCDEKLGLRFSVVPYYLIVIKGGIIPPKYITLES